jgi:metal-responsive CopG/Arc/MetJ family transcriptional regulator
MGDMATKHTRVAVRFPDETLRQIDRLNAEDKGLGESNRSRTIRILTEKGLESIRRGETSADAPTTKRRA